MTILLPFPKRLALCLLAALALCAVAACSGEEAPQYGNAGGQRRRAHRRSSYPPCPKRPRPARPCSMPTAPCAMGRMPPAPAWGRPWFTKSTNPVITRTLPFTTRRRTGYSRIIGSSAICPRYQRCRRRTWNESSATCASCSGPTAFLTMRRVWPPANAPAAFAL